MSKRNKPLRRKMTENGSSNPRITGSIHDLGQAIIDAVEPMTPAERDKLREKWIENARKQLAQRSRLPNGDWIQ